MNPVTKREPAITGELEKVKRDGTKGRMNLWWLMNNLVVNHHRSKSTVFT